MADKKKGGRYTPKGNASPSAGPNSGGRGPGRSGDDDPTPQVGRRPSSPSFLFLVAAAWIASAIVCALYLQAGWKWIPTVFFAGIGLFFLRGALQTIVRHDERLGPDE